MSKITNTIRNANGALTEWTQDNQIYQVVRNQQGKPLSVAIRGSNFSNGLLKFVYDGSGNAVSSENYGIASAMVSELYQETGLVAGGQAIGGGALPDPLFANIVPRQDSTLAALLATPDGQGEFAFATDQPALVWLRSIANGGPVTFAPVPVGSFPNPTTFSVESISSPIGLNLNAAAELNAYAGSVETGSGYGLSFAAGNTNSTIPGEGGGVVSFSAGVNSLDPAYNGYILFGVAGAVPLIVGTDATGAGALAFFDGTMTTKPTVSGSKGANAALTSLIAGLAALGLIDDTTI